MPLDINQPPTNKLLLECGPEGTHETRDTGISIELYSAFDKEWGLDIEPESRGMRRVDLYFTTWDGGISDAYLPLGQVKTLGEVIALYETLSQKKWPGCD